tara:strand:+ start:403 stop:1122 length:720 start_codon:yes stop_codon:yes gene_type:complete
MKDEEKKILSPAEAAAQATPTNFDLESDLPPDADIEDRFNDFWKKNGTFVFAIIALLAVIVVGSQSVGYIEDRGERKLRDQYAQISSNEARLEFAEKHDNHSLGGLAYLELADQSYRAESFLEASNYYDNAAEVLEESNSILANRSKLGSGMAYLRAGDSLGLERLEALANNPDAIEAIRAEAAFHHAYAAWEASNLDDAQRSLDLLGTFSTAPEWQALGNDLQSMMPAAEVPEFGVAS